MVFERNKSGVLDFDCQYRARVECPKNVKLGRMEKIEEDEGKCKSLGMMVCEAWKHGR